MNIFSNIFFCTNSNLKYLNRSYLSNLNPSILKSFLGQIFLFRSKYCLITLVKYTFISECHLEATSNNSHLLSKKVNENF